MQVKIILFLIVLMLISFKLYQSPWKVKQIKKDLINKISLFEMRVKMKVLWKCSSFIKHLEFEKNWKSKEVKNLFLLFKKFKNTHKNHWKFVFFFNKNFANTNLTQFKF